MAIKTFTEGDTFPNLSILISWDGLMEITNASVIMYSGDFGSYSDANPFNGPLTINSVTEQSSGSSLLCSFDVTATDTGTAGVYPVDLRITLESGEIETIQNIGTLNVIID